MILHCGSYLQWWDRRSAIANFLFVLMQWYQRYLHFKDKFDYWAIIYYYFLALKQTSREDGHKLNFSMSTFCPWCAIVLTGDNGHCVDCAPVLTEEECGVVNNCLTTTSTTNNYSDNFVALLYWQQHNFTSKISNFQW